ncbi:MAG: hypothetical protein V1774_03830 [Candidatus Eisenbacteria bacterium]
MFDRRWIGMAILGGVGLAGALMAGGCGGKEAREKAAEEMAEQMIEKSGGGKVDLDHTGEKFSVKTGDYQMESAAATEWPKDLPADIPAFTYGQVERIARGVETEGGRRSYNIWLRDVDPQALTKYDADLKQAGWETALVEMGDQGGMVSAQKEGWGVQFMHAKGDRRANVVVTAE